MIKLIATDMDGTLPNTTHEISQPSIGATKYAQEQGIAVVIATGRAFYEAQAPVAGTDLTVPYICLNGAEVHDKTLNVVNTPHLNKSLVHKTTGVLKDAGIYYQVYTSCAIYTKGPQGDLDIYIDIVECAGQHADVEHIKSGIQRRIDNGTLKVVDNYDAIENMPGELIIKILTFDGSLEKIDKASKILAESPNLTISSSSRGNVEITHSDTQKGIALGTIAERLGIEIKEVMSIGDNLNDLSMLEKVGYPITMESGAEGVKEMAKYVTDTNENSGVGKAIMKLLCEQQV